MKGKKLILPVLLTSMVASPVVANLSTAPIFAETITNVSGAAVTVTNNFLEVNKRGVAIEFANLPKVTTAVDYTVTIKSPNGKVAATYSKATYESSTDYNNNKFTPMLKGNYTFSFRAKTANNGQITTLCDDVVLTVTEDTYAMTMPTNSYWTLPSVVATSNTKSYGLAVPTVAVNGGEEAAAADFSVADYDGSDPTELNTANGLLVTVTDSEGRSQYLTTKVAATATVPAHYEFRATTAGRYTVKYQYYNNGQVVAVYNAGSFRAISGYNAQEQYKLEIALNSSIDNVSKVLGTEITFPTTKTVNTKVSSTDSVSAYTEITVTYLGGSSNSADNAHKNHKDVVTDYKYEFKWAGNYKVEYKVSIPNLGVSSSVLTKYVRGVSDSQKPVISLVDSYEISGNNLTPNGGSATDITDYNKEQIVELIGDLSYTLNSVYELDDTNSLQVKIPAVIATDNYDNPGAIRVEREVYRKGNLSDKLIKLDENDANEVVTLKFGLEADTANDVFKYGTFIVKYYAYDTAHATNPKIDYYEFEVKEHGSLIPSGVTATEAVPTVYLQYFDNVRVNKGDTITVTKPDAVDYKSQDETLDVRTYYYVGAKGLDKADLLAKIGTDAHEFGYNDLKNGKYEFTVPQTGEVVYVFATARNDYNYDNAGFSVRQLTIRGTVVEANAPEFSVPSFTITDEGEDFNGTYTTFNQALGYANGLAYDAINDNGLTDAGKAPFDQLTVVELPTVQFADADGSELSIEVYVYYNGEDASKTTKSNLLTNANVSASADGTTYTVSGGSFEASYAGMYTVTYKASDLGGHTTVQSYGIMIKDTVSPTIIVVDNEKFSGDHEVGTPFAVPQAQIKDNGVLFGVEESDVTWTVITPKNAQVVIDQPTGFTPKTTGDYYIEYTATDGEGNPTTIKSSPIHVVANAALDFNITTYDYDAEPTWETTDDSKWIKIPNATVQMPNLGESVEVSIKVSKGTKEATVRYVNEVYSEFEATAEGEYTVKYSARDRFGRTIENVTGATLTIKVGDCDAPEIAWKSSTNKPSTNVSAGSKWKFDVSMLTVDGQNYADLTDDGVTYTETMTAPDGTKATKDANNNYVFNQEGEYIFRITFEDAAGNSDYEQIRINVTADEDDSTTHASNAVTTVLIVLSVVVLGGVVTYFVLSGKKKTTKKK